MMPDYYDVTAICAEETAVTVQLTYGCSGVGNILDPGSEGPDLAPGAKVDVPLWLAASLANRRQAQVELPIYYGTKMRRKMKAGAGCEDLRVRCPYFYTVAAKVQEAMLESQNADDTFPRFVLSVLRSRYKELLARAITIDNNVEASSLQARLSLEELDLFNAGAEGTNRHEAWRAGEESVHAKLSRSASLKRKWGDDDDDLKENDPVNTSR